MTPITEAEYIFAERQGMILDSLVCPECEDPALCAAEGECSRTEADLGLWDDPEEVELS